MIAVLEKSLTNESRFVPRNVPVVKAEMTLNRERAIMG